MAALQSTPWSAAWLLLAGALCSGCAKPSATDPIEMATHDGGALRDLASQAADDLATVTRHDLATARPRDLAMPTIVRDLTMPAPVMDLSHVDLGPFPPGTFYQISVKSSGQLLSLHNSAAANGTITESQPAHGTGDQRWTLVAAASGASYQIMNGQSQSCLDVNGASTGDGATTWIWTCSVATSQQWMLKDAGGGFYNLINVNSMSCLDLDNGGSAAGTVIFQFHCKGGDNQKWFFTHVP